MPPVLVTERLVLRRFTPADADGLLALDGDPKVMRFLGPAAKTRAQIQVGVLPRLLAAHAQHGDFGFWAADTCSDGAFTGWFGLRPVAAAATAIVHLPSAPPGSNAAVAELATGCGAAPGAMGMRPKEPEH